MQYSDPVRPSIEASISMDWCCSQAHIDKNVDMIAARHKEREYFAETPEYRHMTQRMGCEHLGKVLSRHLETVIKSRIPGLQLLINKTIIELETELSRLGSLLQPMLERAGGEKVYNVFDGQLPAALKMLQFDKQLSMDNVRKLITEADGYQPNPIAPMQGYRRLIEASLVSIKGPAEAAVDAQSKEFRTFRKNGCKHYDLLRQIFPDIAAGQSRHVSGNSIETHEPEGEFLYRNLTFGENEVNGGCSMGGASMRGGNRSELTSMGSGGSMRGGNRTEHPSMGGGGSMRGGHRTEHPSMGGGSSARGGSRSRTCDAPPEQRPAKHLKTERFDDALDAWFTALNAKGVDKASAEKDDMGYIPPELYSVERVMNILEHMIGIPANAYMRALDKLTSPDWRKIFVKMSPMRRRDWLKTLE